MKAVRCNDVTRLTTLLSRGPSPEVLNHDADRDYYGSTPLHEAAFNGFIEIVKLLIGAGANVNVTSPSGRTPLHRAGTGRRADVVRLLVEAGADINATVFDDSRATALHHSVYNDFPDITTLLISLGANINAIDYYGRTPLHWTPNKRRFEIARVLIESGANLNALDVEGKPPRQIAIEAGDTRIVQLIDQAALTPWVHPEVQEAHNQNALLQTELNIVAHERAELQRQVEQLRAELQRSQAKLTTEQQEKEKLVNQNKELQDEIASLHTAADTAYATRTALQRRCEELQRELTAQAASPAEKQELEELRGQKATFEAQKDELETQRTKLESQTEQLESQSKELEQVRTRNRLLGNQVTSLQQTNVQVVSERVTAQRNLNLLQQELESVKAEHAEQSRALQELEPTEEHAEVEAELAYVKKQFKELRRQYKILMNENISLEEALKQMNSERKARQRQSAVTSKPVERMETEERGKRVRFADSSPPTASSVANTFDQLDGDITSLTESELRLLQANRALEARVAQLQAVVDQPNYIPFGVRGWGYPVIE